MLPAAHFDPNLNQFITSNSKLLLEEALYQLEKGQIRLLWNGAEVSIQQLFEMVDLDIYCVYSVMREAGYRLIKPKIELAAKTSIIERTARYFGLYGVEAGNDVEMEFDFHVYNPGQKLSGLPSNRLLILPVNGMMPNLGCIKDQQNVLLALVNGCDIQFLKLDQVM